MNKKDRKFISGESLTDEEIIQRFKIKTVEVRLKEKAQGSSFLMWIVILFFLAGIILYFFFPNVAPYYTSFTLIFFSIGLFLFITVRLNKNLRRFELNGTAEKLQNDLHSEILDIRNKLNIASKTSHKVEEEGMSIKDERQISTQTLIKDWLSKSIIKGTIDSTGGFSVNMETTDDKISSTLKNLALVGKETIAIGDQTEEFYFFCDLQANEINNLYCGGYIDSVGDQSQPFSYKIFLDCLSLTKLQVQKLILKEGPLIEAPIKFGDLELQTLSVVKDEDGDLEAQGEIVGGSNFVYVFDVTEDEPDADYFVNATNASEVEEKREVNQLLMGNAEGDEVFLILGHYSMIENGIELSFSGQAKVEDAYEDDEDYDEELADDEDLEYDEEVSINLEIKHYVFKENVPNYEEFLEVFENAEANFCDLRFEDKIRISDLSCSSKTGRCKSEDEYYSRQINCSINFKINSLSRLKENWENEGIIEEGEINWFELGFYWIEDIDPIFLDHENDITVPIEEREFSGHLEVFKGGSEVNLFEIKNSYSETEQEETYVRFDLSIRQYITKQNAAAYDNFIETFKDPDIDFDDYYLESIEPHEIEKKFKLTKYAVEENSHVREIEFTLEFKTKKIEQLEELLVDEGILDDDELRAAAFVMYWMQGLHAIVVGENEDGDLIEIAIDNMDADLNYETSVISNTADEANANNSGNRNSFDGSVFLVTIQKALQIDDFENLSANNGLIQGPSKTLYLAFNSDNEDYYLVITGQEIFHATAEEFDYEAPKHALETIRQQLESELSLDTDQVDQLIFYLQANVTDEADEIDEASFSHIVAEMGEVNGEDYFEDEEDACNRLWVSTAQNLSYETITIDQDKKIVEFDDEILDQKEVVSWSNFKVSGDINLSNEKLSTFTEGEISKRKSYSDKFKRSVAIAANKKGATLASVGKEFGINPTLVRNWKLKFNQKK